jgi:two-component system cell cycle sensor histidine kinase PleC
MADYVPKSMLRGPQEPRASEPFEQNLSSLQLTHSIEALRDTALTTPVWALIMCALFGGLLPVFGTTSIYMTWPWPIFCLGMASAVYMLAQHVRQAAEEHDLDGPSWLKIVASAHFVVAGSWCLVTLIFWEPRNAANHCFLVAISIAASALYLTSRSGLFSMVVCATLPNLGMIWLHLLRGEMWIDQGLAIVLPIWAAQLHFEAWRSCRVVAAAHRTRFEMEALASELSRARDEAASANRAKSVFLANMSHELRTPLNAILGFAEIITTKALGKTTSPERQHEYVEHIMRSGRHLLALINDVLDIAKIDAGKLVLERRWIDGRAVLQDCVGVFAEQASAGGVALASSASPDGLKLFADERAFRQIVSNLLSNAVKFTPQGGKIMVRLALVDDGAMLSIRDTGCGIPADQLPVIFQPFEQSAKGYGRAQGGGTGLGLALVRSLTDLHGGTCRIDSEVDMGTLVTVFIPNAHGATAPAPESLRKIA